MSDTDDVGVMAQVQNSLNRVRIIFTPGGGFSTILFNFFEPNLIDVFIVFNDEPKLIERK